MIKHLLKILKSAELIFLLFLLVACHKNNSFLYKVQAPPAKNIPKTISGLNSISGQVTDAYTKLPVADAKIQIVSSVSGQLLAWANTDLKGNYIVNSLATGNYSVKFIKLNYAPFYTEKPGEIIGGNTYTVNAAINQLPSSISGTVKDSMREFILSNVRVQLFDTNTHRLVASVFTNTRGVYLLENIYAGNYYVQFDKQGYFDFISDQPAQVLSPRSYIISANLEPKKIKLQGNVKGASSRLPIHEVKVEVFSVDTGRIIAEQTTDTNGDYNFTDLYSGNYSMRFTHLDYLTYTTRDPGIMVGGNTSIVNALLNEQLNYLSGHVVNALNTQSLSGVRVQLLDAVSGVVIKSELTDYYGHYRFSSVPTGNYTMLFTLEHFSDYSTVQPGLIEGGRSYVINAALSKIVEPGQFRIVLTWSDSSSGPNAVKDIDSYLMVPDLSTPIYYDNKGGANVGANLDVDDQDWSGPETITITEPKTGIYHYYIANYSNSSDTSALNKSNVIVTVYGAAGLQKQYTIIPGCGLAYEFFSIEKGVITDVNKFNDNLFFKTSSSNTRKTCP